jgi:hypothetical protein
MGNHPSNRISQKNQADKYGADDWGENQTSNGDAACNDPTYLDIMPMARLSAYYPAHQGAEGRKPDSGKMSQLFSLGIPLNAYHLDAPVMK